MKCKAIFAASLMLPLLGGCATYSSFAAGELDKEDFGEANRQTYAAMIIDPDPQYDEEMEGRSQQGVDAIERVRNDQVKKPANTSTTDGPGS